MLRLTLNKDEEVKIGEDVVIKCVTEGRVGLAISAPRELRVERVVAKKSARESYDAGQQRK